MDRLAFAAAVEEAAANRTQAEQLLFEQQQVVWETIGLPPPATATVPSGQLPSVPAAPPAGTTLARRAHQLAAGRPLLAYLDRETAAAAVRAEGLRIAKRPDVNLVAQDCAPGSRTRSSRPTHSLGTTGRSRFSSRCRSRIDEPEERTTSPRRCTPSRCSTRSSAETRSTFGSTRSEMRSRTSRVRNPSARTPSRSIRPNTTPSAPSSDWGPPPPSTSWWPSDST